MIIPYSSTIHGILIKKVAAVGGAWHSYYLYNVSKRVLTPIYAPNFSFYDVSRKNVVPTTADTFFFTMRASIQGLSDTLSSLATSLAYAASQTEGHVYEGAEDRSGLVPPRFTKSPVFYTS